MRKVKISSSAASPSCTATVRGGPFASHFATVWFWPFSDVATWTQPSWTSRMSMSRGENLAPVRTLT